MSNIFLLVTSKPIDIVIKTVIIKTKNTDIILCQIQVRDSKVKTVALNAEIIAAIPLVENIRAKIKPKDNRLPLLCIAISSMVV